MMTEPTISMESETPVAPFQRFFRVGLMAGSYVFAEASGWLARTVNRWGDRGMLTFDRVLNLKPQVLVPVVATVLVLVLAAIHVFVDPTP